MRKLFILTTLLFGLLLAGCSEDNNGSQAGNNGSAGFEGDNPALSIITQYAGGLRVNFHATLYGNTLGETYTYLWDFGDHSNSDQNAQTNIPNPTYDYSAEGTYTIKVSVSKSTGEMIGSTSAQVIVSTSGNILKPTVESTKNPNDMLSYTFFTPAHSDDYVPLEYTWDFKDGQSPIKGANKISYKFSKYGKTYTPEVKIENKATGKSAIARTDVTIPKPDFHIECSTSGLLVSCTPVVTDVEGGLNDSRYTWTFGDVSSGAPVTVETAGTDPAVYTFAGPGQKVITVTGTSSDVEGTFTANTNVSISNQISLGNINCSPTGGLLEYTCDIYATLADDATGTLSYVWKFNNEIATGYDNNTATFAFSKFPPLNNPSYPVTVDVKLTDSRETASQSTRISITHPTVTISKATASTNTAASFNATLSQPVSGATYTWSITGPSNFSKVVSGTDKTNTGDVELPHEGTYTANLTVSHGTFAQAIVAAPFQVTSSAAVEDAEISCTQADGMKYQCTTNARGYATVDGVRKEVPLTYQWNITRGDQGESYNNSNKTFTQQLQKYDGTYRVNLVLIPQGTNKAVRAPQVEFKTGKPTLTLNRSTATVGVTKSATFTPALSGLMNNINLKGASYTWRLDGNVQPEKTESYTRTFNSAGTHTVRVDITAENLGSTLTAQTSVDVVAVDFKPEYIQSVVVECTTPNEELDGIKKQCTATATLSTAGNAAGAQVGDLDIYLIPRGTRGQADSPAVVYKSGDTKNIIFDWPYVNIAEIANRDVTRTFQANLGIHVYSKGKKIKEFTDKGFTIKIPKVSYELQHRSNTANNIVGTGAKIRLKSTQAPFNGQANWEWKMNFKGLKGNSNKFFTIDVGQEADFKQQMINARFSGNVKGNPYELQSGFGVKITPKSGANILSKPLYLYGVNTPQGIQEDPHNALGNFLGRGIMIPEGTMGWEGFAVRDPGSHGFLASFVVRVDPAYKTYGWDVYCVIGAIGKRNGKQWEYSIPEAEKLVGHPTQQDRFSAMIGAYGSLEEKRMKNVAQNGQPKLPDAVNNGMAFELPGYWFNMAEWGLRGVHVGYMSTPGNLQGCLELKRYDYNKTTTGGWFSESVYNPYR